MGKSKRTDIFVCYRSDDSGPISRMLRDALRRRLNVSVFFDDGTIAPGEPFPARIEAAIDEARCLLVVIGNKWLSAADEFHRRRIDDPDDWVHREVERGLARGEGLQVIPLLVDDVALPRAVALPETLRPLTDRQAFTLRSRGFDGDVERLIQHLSTQRGWALKAEGAGPAALDDSHAIEEYRRRASELHRSVPLIGFETRVRVPIRLDDLYVPLRAMPDLRAHGSAAFADAKDAERYLRDAELEREVELADSLGYADRLGGRRGVVLLGDPGSGKTTYLKRLLVWLCDGGAHPELALAAGAIPVYVPLRDARPPAGETTIDLEDVVARRLRADDLEVADDFARRLLARADLVFLLDGLDEVGEPGDRGLVARAIERLRRRHPTARFVVTCRYAGYSDAVRLPEQFVELHVRPLDESQADAFVRNWYRIVEHSLEPDAARADRLAAERTEALVTRIHERDFRAQRVYELTHNPLLLTAICLVHRDRGDLPRRRVELYEECIHVLLEGWRRAKELPIVLGARQARAVLQPVAFWLHERERTRASAEELGPIVEPALRGVTGDQVDAAAFLRTIRDQSGLLTGWSDDTYGFMHLGFQEYLAALEIRSRAFDDKGVLEMLADNFGASWWQEVTLLLLAAGDPPLFDPLMRLVSERAAFADAEALVKACVEDTLSRSAAPFVDLLRRDPGDDADLWRRQAVAMRVLRSSFPDEIAPLEEHLRVHPAEELRPRIEAVARSRKVVSPADIELVEIPGGRFMMGSPLNEPDRDADEGPQHEVQVKTFWISPHPITNAQYARYLAATGGKAPAFWGERRFNLPQQPVVGVEWDEAKYFCHWAGVRLPSEAEWEYACRAGTITRYWSGDTVADLERGGWFNGNSGDKLHEVAQKPPNPLGLYDMHGNVWEWCEDEWHKDYRGAPPDGRPWMEGEEQDVRRVIRGGSFASSPKMSRAACRNRNPGYVEPARLGFRVCLVTEP